MQHAQSTLSDYSQYGIENLSPSARRVKIFLMTESQQASEMHEELQSYLPSERPDEEVKLLLDETGDVSEIVYEQFTAPKEGEDVVYELLDVDNAQIIRVEEMEGQEVIEVINAGKALGLSPRGPQNAQNKSVIEIFDEETGEKIVIKDKQKAKPLRLFLPQDDMSQRVPLAEELKRHPLVQNVEPITSEDVQKRMQEKPKMQPVVIEVKPSLAPVEDNMEDRIPLKEEIKQHPLVQDAKPITFEDVEKKLKERPVTQKREPVLEEVPYINPYEDNMEDRIPLKEEIKQHPLVQDVKPITSEDVERKLRERPTLPQQKEQVPVVEITPGQQPVTVEVTPQRVNVKQPMLKESLPLKQEMEEPTLQNVQSMPSDAFEPEEIVERAPIEEPVLTPREAEPYLGEGERVVAVGPAQDLNEQEMEEERMMEEEDRDEREKNRVPKVGGVDQHHHTKDRKGEKWVIAEEKARGRMYLGESSLRGGVDRFKAIFKGKKKGSKKSKYAENY